MSTFPLEIVASQNTTHDPRKGLYQAPQHISTLSRVTNPKTNVLIKRFWSDVLAVIANIDNMKAMQKELVESEKKRILV